MSNIYEDIDNLDFLRLQLSQKATLIQIYEQREAEWRQYWADRHGEVDGYDSPCHEKLDDARYDHSLIAKRITQIEKEQEEAAERHRLGAAQYRINELREEVRDRLLAVFLAEAEEDRERAGELYYDGEPSLFDLDSELADLERSQSKPYPRWDRSMSEYDWLRAIEARASANAPGITKNELNWLYKQADELSDRNFGEPLGLRADDVRLHVSELLHDIVFEKIELKG